MVASIRKLDCCGVEIWRTTTAHGPQLAIDFDCRSDAESVVLANCRRASAWPLIVDLYLTPGKLTESRIYSSETESRVL